MHGDRGKARLDGEEAPDAEGGPAGGRSRSFTSRDAEARGAAADGPARPKRRMSRRYSHHRNESAPDFFDDLDVLNTLMPKADAPEDEGGASHRRTRSKDRSPAASAVFTTTTGAVPLRQPTSDVKGARPLHLRRRSGSSDDWETGLKQALNLEVNKFKSEETISKMKTKYRRALQPRGMLKVPGSPAMRTSTVNASQSRLLSQHSGKKPGGDAADGRHAGASNPGDSGEAHHHIKPRSLDMDALVAGRDSEDPRGDPNATSRSDSALGGGYRRALHHQRAGSRDDKAPRSRRQRRT